ncbi:hypothetical protein AB1N83_003631 [Pleurotus pulmonarius]
MVAPSPSDVPSEMLRNRASIWVTCERAQPPRPTLDAFSPRAGGIGGHRVILPNREIGDGACRVHASHWQPHSPTHPSWKPHNQYGHGLFWTVRTDWWNQREKGDELIILHALVDQPLFCIQATPYRSLYKAWVKERGGEVSLLRVGREKISRMLSNSSLHYQNNLMLSGIKLSTRRYPSGDGLSGTSSIACTESRLSPNLRAPFENREIIHSLGASRPNFLAQFQGPSTFNLYRRSLPHYLLKRMSPVLRKMVDDKLRNLQQNLFGNP